MNKILAILFLFNTMLWAQQDNEVDKIIGNVRSIESKTYKVKDYLPETNPNYFYIKYYSRAGFVSNIKFMGEVGFMDSEEVYTYQNDGKILKIETLKSNGKINKTTSFEYDVFNNLLSEKKLNYKYDIESQSTYLYDGSQKLISKDQHFSKINYTTKDRYMYNDQNQLTEISKEDSSGITREIFTYYPNGMLFTKDEYNSKNEKFSSILYEYNVQGDKISLFKFDISGELTYFEQYEYQYDATGNWTEKKSYTKGDLTSIEKRVLVYY